ncbi:MAG TPA: hypothetical protein VJN96_07860 [Vicinamibacterales bacterium]|nr:hypothetical protein [Vicinamibacterales bacterium]
MLLATTLIAVMTFSIQEGVAQTLSANGILDQYAGGNADSVVRTLATSSESVSAFSRDLKTTAQSWIAARGSADARKRELAVATVALEAARWMKPAPFGSFSVMRDDPTWENRVDLIEWACELLRKHDPALPAERSWHLAALALIEEASSLFHAYAKFQSIGKHHVAHARLRFPDERRIDLAEAVIDLLSAGILGYPMNVTRPNFVAVVEESGTADVPGKFGSNDTRRRVQLAVEELAALLNDEHVGAEAQLRLGAIELYLSQGQLALAHFDETLRLTKDPFLCYHARFFRAAALVGLNRVPEAEADYRTALQLAPRAQSATVGLAWLLAVNNRASDASGIVSDALSSGTIHEDPYASYDSGDFRMWTRYIADVREAIR